MAHRTPRMVAPKGIDNWEVRDAVNTVSRAREHLSNPKMVQAMKKHVADISAAVSGPMKPKRLGPAARKGVK